MVGIEHPALQLLICTHYEMEKIKEYRNGVKPTMWFFIIIFFSIFFLLNSDTSYHSWEGKIDRLWSFIVTITSSFNSIFLNLLYLMFLSKPHKNVWIHIIKGRMKKHVLSFHAVPCILMSTKTWNKNSTWKQIKLNSKFFYGALVLFVFGYANGR